MDDRKEKLSLFIFIDAFGWEVKQRHPAFLKDLIHESKRLDTILGYSSACDPSIISGLTPAEHKLWSSFYYDPEGCPYKWTRLLRFLPDALFLRGRVRHYMSRIIKNICGFTGYFQIYGVPFQHLPLFNYAEQKRIWEPGGLPRGTSIFDRLTEKFIPYYVHNSDCSDEQKLKALIKDIRSRRIYFAYCSLGQLDGLMHHVGNNDPQIDTLMQAYDKQLRQVIAEAEKNYKRVNWYVFTDHGMHNVTGSHDLITEVEALGLRWKRDYVAFYDSTMARFWILNEAAREPITQRLKNHTKGRLLPDEELQELGVYFEDRQYGDLIFLMNSGIQIAPSFMNPRPVKGMHGYHPSDADSYAAISSNKPIPPEVTKIQHLHRIMLDEMGLN